MSKRPNIRWRKSDNEELRKAVKNFNAKLTRLNNKYQDDAENDLSDYLPIRERVRDLRKEIRTREDYNKVMTRLMSFTQRDIETAHDIHREGYLFSDRENQRLHDAVKKFNQKIDRLSNDPKIKNALPEKATVKQYKKIINSRQDLNREIKSLNRFLKDGAEVLVDAPDNQYNLKLTKWQKDEMLRRVPQINEAREERKKYIESLPATSRGKELGYDRGGIGMGNADSTNLAPMNAFTDAMTRNSLNKKFRGILKESQDDYWLVRERILKSTYIKTLRQQYKEDDIRDVIREIQNMPLADFYKTFQEEGGNFEYAYHPDQEQYEAYVNALKSVWKPET